MIVLTLIESSLIIQIGVLSADIATAYGAADSLTRPCFLKSDTPMARKFGQHTSVPI